MLCARYTVILFMFPEQLKNYFTGEQAAKVNKIYIHKIILHSVIIFGRGNLAACSCEQGESLLSVFYRILQHTNFARPDAQQMKIFS